MLPNLLAHLVNETDYYPTLRKSKSLSERPLKGGEGEDDSCNSLHRIENVEFQGVTEKSGIDVNKGKLNFGVLRKASYIPCHREYR